MHRNLLDWLRFMKLQNKEQSITVTGVTTMTRKSAAVVTKTYELLTCEPPQFRTTTTKEVLILACFKMKRSYLKEVRCGLELGGCDGVCAGRSGVVLKPDASLASVCCCSYSICVSLVSFRNRTPRASRRSVMALRMRLLRIMIARGRVHIRNTTSRLVRRQRKARWLLEAIN